MAQVLPALYKCQESNQVYSVLLKSSVTDFCFRSCVNHLNSPVSVEESYGFVDAKCFMNNALLFLKTVLVSMESLVYSSLAYIVVYMFKLKQQRMK